eukprot:1157957-Pelagomonas_calceolata.AAC.10
MQSCNQPLWGTCRRLPASCPHSYRACCACNRTYTRCTKEIGCLHLRTTVRSNPGSVPLCEQKLTCGIRHGWGGRHGQAYRVNFEGHEIGCDDDGIQDGKHVDGVPKDAQMVIRPQHVP